MTIDTARRDNATTEWISRLPKVDLHCHLIGTIRPSTFAEFARRENLVLPADPERIFADINSRPPDPALYRNTVIPVPQGPTRSSRSRPGPSKSSAARKT
jgi:adenosine deaminase